ncbi:MAG: ABC transporter ATP-binding protein [Pirellulales bacterium]
MTLLKLDKLTVRFGGLTAVHQVDCSVDEQRIFSVIGPNGAGKTTVFNAITGIYEPTSGTIEFCGKPLERPFSWRSVLLCGLVGIVTGLTAAILALDINALWRATIKRNYAGPGSPFSYAAAWADVGAYWRGDLALEAVRGGRWAVRTADGRQTLGYGETRTQAEAIRANFTQLIQVSDAARRSAPDDKYLRQSNGKWVIRNRDDTADLATFDTAADARAIMANYTAITAAAAARRRDAVVALVLGAAIGAAGSWAVWRRARRSPEVISRAGVARTFQNIRLFQNMTVLENVLTAMDRHLAGGLLGMAIRTPGSRRREADARGRAQEWLDFVGLRSREGALAKNLPYGDQRRLEIARALATRPRLILLDEPAAGMNPTESADLNRLIERIREQGLTVMLIEHHMRVVMGISDRIAVLDYGIKIAEGTPDEVRANPQVIAAYLGSEEVH